MIVSLDNIINELKESERKINLAKRKRGSPGVILRDAARHVAIAQIKLKSAIEEIQNINR